MKSRRHRHLSRLAVLLAMLVADLLPVRPAPAEDRPVVPVSSFAPADDLLHQVDFFIGRLDKALAEPDKFDAARQSRAWKDSNTLAVLAMMLAAHDEPHPLKKSMPVMLDGAQQVAAAESDAQQAVEGLTTIKSARAGDALTDEPLEPEKVTSMAALMKQVPLLHAQLRRGVTPRRLKRMAQQSAGHAATLAAIAAAAMLDDEYVGSPDDAALWQAHCVAMRDAAGDVNSAVRAQDQARVDAGMMRLLTSCEACHADFR